jgi:cobalamin-dependent methionine synthase I
MGNIFWGEQTHERWLHLPQNHQTCAERGQPQVPRFRLCGGVQDTDEVRNVLGVTKPVILIEGPLRDDTSVVGNIFGAGNLFLPQMKGLSILGWTHRCCNG